MTIRIAPPMHKAVIIELAHDDDVEVRIAARTLARRLGLDLG